MLWVGWVSKGRATGYPRVLASLGKVHLRALILGTESMTFWFFFTLSQWPKLFHYGKTGNNLLKCLCFCTFLKIDFLRGDWVGWGKGGMVRCRATGRSSSPVLQLGRGLLPSGLPANPEVLYSLSRVSALCYCFSLFIKCVWITLEMLWLIFFFQIKILKWVWKVWRNSLQPAAFFASICNFPQQHYVIGEETS